MFDSIRGHLLEKDPARIVVEAHGIGYRIFIPLSTYTKLPNVHESVHLFLSQVVREDAHTLYGFCHREERDLFETLITLSGIGPKTAIAIIGHIDIHTFHHAIQTGDLRLLSKIPGIGKKTGERLIIEMKDKIKPDKKGGKTPFISGFSDSLHTDALYALLNLGYTPMQAQKALSLALEEKPQEKELGKLITAALQKI